MTVFKCNNVNVIAEICPAELIAKNERIGLAITKEEVHSGSYDRVFRQFEEFRKAGRAAGNKLCIIFEGYDNDRRQIWNIPEIRSFIATIHAFYPELLYYLDAEKHNPILSCLLKPGRNINYSNGGTHTEIPRTKENNLILWHLLMDMENYYQSLS